jgi:FAD/FMN-containing dehydrogenase
MPYFLEMADPAAVELMRSIKKVFDPLGILGPERVLGASGAETGAGAAS